MEKGQNRSLLLILLFLYLVARICQLYAGRIPSLLIVALHVIPPALFALIHGTRTYGSRRILSLYEFMPRGRNPL